MPPAWTAEDAAARLARALGTWLRAHKGRIVRGRRFVTDGERQRAALWRLAEGAARPPADAEEGGGGGADRDGW